MKWTIPALVLVASFISPAVGAEVWWRVFGEIKPGRFAGGHHESEAGDPEELAAMLKQTRFDEWVTHEDEFVRISYPKHPLLKLEVQGDSSGIQVEGSVCTTVDNSFEKAYVLKAGSATYGVFLLNPAAWLDDGICFCGPMVHHVYREEGGCLARFSLLPGGAVKKAQLLGDKVRLMAFEWTHLACPRPVYEEMVERMQLKLRHPLDQAALRQEVGRRYGKIGLSGWVHPGTTLAEAASIMGAEPEIQDGIAIWKFDANDYHFALRGRIEDGRVVAILDEGPSATSKEPIEGTLRWADHVLDSIGEDGRKPTDGELGQLAGATLKAAAAPDAAERRWLWMRILHTLVTEHGVRDAAIGQLILRDGTGSKEEIEILSALAHPDLAGWVSGRLEKMSNERPSQAPPELFASVAEQRAADAAFLLEWMIDHQQQDAAVSGLRRLLETGEPAWLAAAVQTSPRLPPDFAQSVLRQGLESAMRERDGNLAEACLSAIGAARLEDPAVLLPLVEKLPEGEPDSGWAEARQNALATLRKPRE